MKRLIYILLLVIGWNTLTAQTYQVNNQKIRFMNALGIPAKDTAAANWANAADTSIILIRPGDSTLWYKYKGDFRKVGTGGGTAIVDTVNTISSKPWRQKGVDSVTALISPRITDSLRALVRLRASGSGGIQLQNSVGANVADFGIANTTNGSIAGGWNVGGNLLVTGTSGFTGKATFSDSIVGVNQRLSGSLSVNTINASSSININTTPLADRLFYISGTSQTTGTNQFLGVLNPTFTTGTNLYGLYVAPNNTHTPTNRYAFYIDQWTGSATNDYSFYNASTSRSYYAGNVGIKNTNPTVELDVTGAGRFSGALTANGKATFTDSIVGVNMRLTGSAIVANRLGIGTTNPVVTAMFSNAGASGMELSAGSASASGGTLIEHYNRGTSAYVQNRNIASDFVFDVYALRALTINSDASTTLSGALTANGKATFTDSIVGVNQRLSGSISVSSLGLFNTTNDYNHALQVGGVITAKSSNRAVSLDPANKAINSFIISSGNPDTLKVQTSGQPFVTGGSTISTGALTATAQGNNITVTVDSTTITTSGYTLVLGDAGKFFRIKNGSTALTVTIPANSSVAFPVGTLIGIQQQGTAQITIAGASGVQIESEGSLTKTAGQNAGIYLMKTSGDIWLLVGNRG